MMKVTVKVTGSLRRLLSNKTVVTLDGETLGDLINQLATQFGTELKEELLDNGNDLYYGYVVFCRGERLCHVSDRITDGDEILILSALAGG